MRRTNRNSHRSSVKYRFKIVCSKHDYNEIERQMRVQAGGKVRAAVELSSADRCSWVLRVCRSAIKAF